MRKEKQKTWLFSYCAEVGKTWNKVSTQRLMPLLCHGVPCLPILLHTSHDKHRSDRLWHWRRQGVGNVMKVLVSYLVLVCRFSMSNCWDHYWSGFKIGVLAQSLEEEQKTMSSRAIANARSSRLSANPRPQPSKSHRVYSIVYLLSHTPFPQKQVQPATIPPKYFSSLPSKQFSHAVLFHIHILYNPSRASVYVHE